MQPKKLAQFLKEAALDKQAENPVLLNVGPLTNIANYFLVAHGNSDRHVRAIAQGLIDKAKDKKLKIYHLEGMDEGQWILVDFGDVLAHIFYRETREFYGLERLWGDAKTV